MISDSRTEEPTKSPSVSPTAASFCDPILIEMKNFDGLSSSQISNLQLQDVITNLTHHAVAESAEKYGTNPNAFFVEFGSASGSLNIVETLCAFNDETLTVLAIVLENEEDEISLKIKERMLSLFGSSDVNSVDVTISMIDLVHSSTAASHGEAGEQIVSTVTSASDVNGNNVDGASSTILSVTIGLIIGVCCCVSGMVIITLYWKRAQSIKREKSVSVMMTSHRPIDSVSLNAGVTPMGPDDGEVATAQIPDEMPELPKTESSSMYAVQLQTEGNLMDAVDTADETKGMIDRYLERQKMENIEEELDE